MRIDHVLIFFKEESNKYKGSTISMIHTEKGNIMPTVFFDIDKNTNKINIHRTLHLPGLPDNEEKIENEAFDKILDSLNDLFEKTSNIRNFFKDFKDDLNNNDLEDFIIETERDHKLEIKINLGPERFAYIHYVKDKNYLSDNKIEFVTRFNNILLRFEINGINAFYDKQIYKLLNTKRLRIKSILNMI